MYSYSHNLSLCLQKGVTALEVSFVQQTRGCTVTLTTHCYVFRMEQLHWKVSSVQQTRGRTVTLTTHCYIFRMEQLHWNVSSVQPTRRCTVTLTTHCYVSRMGLLRWKLVLFNKLGGVLLLSHLLLCLQIGVTALEVSFVQQTRRCTVTLTTYCYVSRME